jgi:teichuronic acid biosynthesis glycosyltransferase TuaH
VSIGRNSKAGPASADWHGLVVVVAGSPWRGPQFASHHVARALTVYAPVLYVDPPVSRLSVLRRPDRRSYLREPRLELVAPSLARVVPVTQPWPYRAGSRLLTERIVRRSINRAVWALGGDVHAALEFGVSNRVFGAVGESIAVFYAKDDASAAGDLLDRSGRFLAAREQWLADHADLVVAHSPRLVERWSSYDPVFVPNGVDSDFFADTDVAPHPSDVTLAPPIAGYIGQLSKRFDLAALEEVAARGHSLLLVGRRQSSFDLNAMRGILDLPNVQWVGPKTYDELPSYLRTMDVGLVPYSRSTFNEASFPLKLLEYLAAGRPVVSTDLPASRWLATDLVATENDPARFADRVEAAFAASARPEIRESCRTFAEQHSWARRAEILASALGLSRRDGAATLADTRSSVPK